jgi:hypothetical protein
VFRTKTVEVNNVYAQSPIPILESPHHEWSKFCNRSGIPYNTQNTAGMFYYNMPDGFPQYLIVINSTLANYQKIAVAWHEIGHHQCYVNKCKCFHITHLKNGYSEFHAIKYCIEKCIEHTQLGSLFYTLRCVCAGLISTSNAHRYGSEKIVLDPIWKLATSKVPNELRQWVTSRPKIYKKMIQNAIQPF